MKKIVFLIIFLVFILSFPFFSGEVKAGTGDNVSGWAWSENIGWISFNSVNTGGSTDYGVNVDLAIGDFSGYAWSESIGWIRFDPPDTTPDGTINPATLDFITNEVSGWARACVGAANADCTGGTNSEAGGWDGWIKLRGETIEAVPTPYGVSFNSATTEFEGWAWGSDVVGWVSFNCSNQGCGPSNYKVSIGVVNLPPTAINLNVDNPSNYCFFPTPPIFLNWEYSDPNDVPPGTDSQSAYQVQVATDSSFLSIVVDSCDPAPGTCASGNTSTTYAPPGLSFSTLYYWRVTVWDSENVPSAVTNGLSFTTGARPPFTDFTFAPPSPGVDEIIQFTDGTTFHGTSGTENWAWDFGDGIGTSIAQDPTYSYSATGGYSVTLTAADSNGSCPFTQLLASTSLPEWKEISPTSFFSFPSFAFLNFKVDKFLASILSF